MNSRTRSSVSGVHERARARPLAVWILCVLAPTIAVAQHPVELKDVLSVREFADRVPIALSSDGRYVAFTLLDKLRADSLAASRTSRYFAATGAPTDVLGADVFVTDTRAGETTNLTRGRGSSWGPAWSPDGYSALALLVQTNRFKAGVSSGGFSNLFAQYGEMRSDGSAVGINWSERDQGRMGGSPWEFRTRYFENSPFFFLDRVTAPVLLLHGAADRTVLPARAEETFVALRRLGKTVVLVRYEGEEHHPGSWRFTNAADYWNRIFRWFEEHLRGR